MQIDFENSRLKIGIRDFVSFAQSSYPTTPVNNLGNWRTTLGQQWHQQLWQESLDQFASNAKAEVPVVGTLQHSGWHFELSGRIDQILYETDQTIIREVKTTQQILPQPPPDLRAMYPDYFEQLACYELLIPEQLHDPSKGPLVSELLMLHVDTGIRQVLQLDQSPEDILKPRLQTWVDFLEGQRSSDQRIRHLVVPEAFEILRDDQIPVRELLFRTLGETESTGPKKTIAMQAATGFGKTSIAIEWALQGIKQKHFDRIIYLTGKNTGQQQVVEELQRFRKESEGIRYFQVRNMESHLRVCPHIDCPCEQRKRDSSPQLESYMPYLKVEALIKGGSPDMETIALSASSYHICPRLISQSALAVSEFWIADYNYVFAPGARGLLDSIPHFEAERTLLILDETHNLHDRVCGNFSCRFTTYQGEQILSALRDVRASRAFLGSIEAFIRWIRKLPERKVLDMSDSYQLKDLLDSIHHLLSDNGRTLVELPEMIMESLWDLETAWQSMQNPNLELVHWCPKDGILHMTCIDASKVIRDTIQEFSQTLFMSATFPTAEVFEAQTRIPEAEVFRIEAQSEWRNRCYQVAIDTRVNTTYKRREQYFQTTAQTLIDLRASSLSPILSFFPSYHYAQCIAEYIKVLSPGCEVFTMPRPLSPEDQIEAIEEAVSGSDILCLPLGSGLSEGIDMLGGRIDTVVVVSPALPEVNPIQQARTEQFSNSKLGFQQVYQIPGMTKVNQALGRIVRNPEHRARVLLHCDRFAQSEYRNLLSEEYRDAEIIRSDGDFERWLMKHND